MQNNMTKIYEVLKEQIKIFLQSIVLCAIPDINHCKRVKHREEDSPNCSQLILFKDTRNTLTRHSFPKKKIVWRNWIVRCAIITSNECKNLNIKIGER